MSRRREIGVSILETCWRAHITIVTLCHPFVVYHTCTIWWEGTKTTQISSRGPKGVEEENELICHQYIMGQIIWLYLTFFSISRKFESFRAKKNFKNFFKFFFQKINFKVLFFKTNFGNVKWLIKIIKFDKKWRKAFFLLIYFSIV